MRSSIETSDVVAADATVGAPNQPPAAGGAAPPVTQPLTGGSHSEPADAGPQPVPTVPVADAGAEVTADASPGAAVDAGGDPGPVLPAVPELPQSLFTACEEDEDCGDGLVCLGSGPGSCSQPCEQDEECLDLFGFDFTCSSSESACRLLCTPGGAGRVPCPEPLSCIEGFIRSQCGYAADDSSSAGGGSSSGLFEPCNPDLGDAGCSGDLACYRDESLGDGLGYCTERCDSFGSSGGGCGDLPNDSQAALGCSSEGMCRLDCSQGSCPFGMECSWLSGRARCQYPR